MNDADGDYSNSKTSTHGYLNTLSGDCYLIIRQSQLITFIYIFTLNRSFNEGHSAAMRRREVDSWLNLRRLEGPEWNRVSLYTSELGWINGDGSFD